MLTMNRSFQKKQDTPIPEIVQTPAGPKTVFS
jgi:hypothetical protein